MALVQITSRELRDDRVPRGMRPVFELHLEADQEIVDFKAHENLFDNGERKTVDHRATVWIATNLDRIEEAPDA